MVKKLIFLMLILAFVSCKTVIINTQTQKIANSNIELLSIGETDVNIQSAVFEMSAIPHLEQKIRLSALVLPFNKATYKAYQKAAKLQGKKAEVRYIDSLPHKPSYLTLKIADKVTFIDELNDDKNSTVINYLKTVKEANLVTALTLAFDAKTIELIRQAEEIYITNEKFKKYHLLLYKNKKLLKEIEFSKGISFAYQLSSFCWNVDKFGKPVILNIVDENSKCPNNTYDDIGKIKQQKKYSIKF